MLYLRQQGETIGRTEATEAFFAITKLWQSRDSNLRRLVYLAVKEFCDISNDVIIVTSRFVMIFICFLFELYYLLLICMILFDLQIEIREIKVEYISALQRI